MSANALWQPQDISKGSVTFQPGQRYAVLASVGGGTTLAAIQKYVQGKGFQVTYACEILSGSADNCLAKRDQYNIDTWLSEIKAQPRSGERWVYAEGNFTGSSPWTVSVTDSFPQTLVVTYSISTVFEAQAAATPTTPQPIPSAPATPTGSSSSGAGYVVAGAAVVAVGGILWWMHR